MVRHDQEGGHRTRHTCAGADARAAARPAGSGALRPFPAARVSGTAANRRTRRATASSPAQSRRLRDQSGQQYHGNRQKQAVVEGGKTYIRLGYGVLLLVLIGDITNFRKVFCGLLQKAFRIVFTRAKGLSRPVGLVEPSRCRHWYTCNLAMTASRPVHRPRLVAKLLLLHPQATPSVHQATHQHSISRAGHPRQARQPMEQVDTPRASQDHKLVIVRNIVAIAERKVYLASWKVPVVAWLPIEQRRTAGSAASQLPHLGKGRLTRARWRLLVL